MQRLINPNFFGYRAELTLDNNNFMRLVLIDQENEFDQMVMVAREFNEPHWNLILDIYRVKHEQFVDESKSAQNHR